jgi:hypothetical protein
VRKFAPEARLERAEEMQLAPVVAAVVRTTERDDAIRVIAAPERAGHQVRRVNRPCSAYQAAELPNLVTLGAGGRAHPRAPQRRPPTKRPGTPQADSARERGASAERPPTPHP